jgi:starvation-inducible DNA-binding protein
METYLGIEISKRDNITNHLNELLADYHLYYQKLRNFHWNIYGDSFFELHNQFEELYDEAREQIDELAERILALGNRPVSNFSEYLETATIEEAQGSFTAPQMVELVVADFEILVKKLKKGIAVTQEGEDVGTEDLLTGYLKATEKHHWMFSAYLKKEKETVAIA